MGSCSRGMLPPWVAMLAPGLPWPEGGKQEELWKGQLRPRERVELQDFIGKWHGKGKHRFPLHFSFTTSPCQKAVIWLYSAAAASPGLMGRIWVHLSCECTAGTQNLQQQILISVLASQLMLSPLFLSLRILNALWGEAVEGLMPPRRSCGGFISHVLVFGKKK